MALAGLTFSLAVATACMSAAPTPTGETYTVLVNDKTQTFVAQ